MEPLEFSFTPTAEDYTRAIRAFNLRQPLYILVMIVPGLLAFCFVLSILLAWVLRLISMNDPVTTWGGLLTLLILTASIPFSFLVIHPYLISRRIKKNVNYPKIETWLLEEDHLTIISSQSKNEVKWGVFAKVMESKQYFFVAHAMNKHTFLFIPKRAFNSPEQETLFRQYVEKFIGPIKGGK